MLSGEYISGGTFTRSKLVSLAVAWVRMLSHVSKSLFTHDSLTTCKRSRQTKAASWDADIAKALIGIRGQEGVQSQLDSIVRNRAIYEQVAKKLEEAIYYQTWQ